VDSVFSVDSVGSVDSVATFGVDLGVDFFSRLRVYLALISSSATSPIPGSAVISPSLMVLSCSGLTLAVLRVLAIRVPRSVYRSSQTIVLWLICFSSLHLIRDKDK